MEGNLSILPLQIHQQIICENIATHWRPLTNVLLGCLFGFLSRFWNRCGPNFSHAGADMAQPCMALYHQPCLAMEHGTLKRCWRHSLAGHQEEAKNCCEALTLAADGQMPFWGQGLQAIWYGRLWQGGSTPVSSKALSYMQAHPERGALAWSPQSKPVQNIPKQYLPQNTKLWKQEDQSALPKAVVVTGNRATRPLLCRPPDFLRDGIPLIIQCSSNTQQIC